MSYYRKGLASTGGTQLPRAIKAGISSVTNPALVLSEANQAGLSLYRRGLNPPAPVENPVLRVVEIVSILPTMLSFVEGPATIVSLSRKLTRERER